MNNKKLLSMAFLLSVTLSSMAQALQLKLNNVTVKKAMTELKQKSDYSFVYEKNDIDTEKRVNVDAKDLKQAVGQILNGQSVTYEIQGKNIIIKKKAKSNNQQKVPGNYQVSGLIKDALGEPIIGATIMELGTNNGTLSDMDGAFNMKVTEGAMLRITYIGYKTQELKANSDLKITLQEDSKLMDEVVVVGYGVQKKSDLTGSVASINAKSLEGRPQPNIIQSLQGMVPGLNITLTGNNAEGSSTTTRIRGTKSISADSKPLIILDGVPFDGPWSEINPNDIESIEVLKDASSAAIYGARGANGVILVTSKRGDASRLVVSYNTYLVLDKPINLPNLMDGNEFWKYKEEALRLANTTTPTADNPTPWMGAFTATELAMHEAGESTDWLDLVTRTGVKQQHNLSLRGGAAKTSYFISLNYVNNKGTGVGNEFQRYNIRFNLDQQFTSWLEFSTSTQLGRYDRSGSSASFWRAFRMPPITKAYNEDGTIPNASWEDSSEAFAVNPLSSLNNKTKDVRVKVITNNAIDISIPFIKGLSYKLNTGFTYANSSWKQYQGLDTYYGARTNGTLNTDDWHTEDWLIENIITYNREFGKHRLFVTGLYSAQSHEYEQNTMEGKGFPNDVMYYYQMSKAATASGASSYSKENHISQMGRINYSYDERYLLTLTARRDGYSAFGSETKFGIFPSLAIGWNISNEKFIKDKPIGQIISNLKYRLSWGKNGNEAIGAYATLPNLSTFNYLNDDHSAAYGFYPSKLASPNLGWETTTSINTGIDLALWNGRIRTTFDMYWSKTNDLLLDRSIPTINGTGSITENRGKTKGNGWEWQITSNNITTKDFSWSTTLNLSHYHNEIVNVGLFDENGNAIDDVASRKFIGQPINVNYDYNFIGVWQIEDPNNPEGAQDSRNPFSIPGYMKYEDLNGDGVINTEDRKIIGSTEPTINMGLMNNLSYKDFYLSFFLTAQVGQTANNELYDCSTMSYRQNRLMVNFWTPDNPTNDYPKNSLDTSVNPMNSLFYEKTDYLRLADLTFGYRLPQSLLKNIFISRVEAYVNIKNLFTWTTWTGMDPEFISDQLANPPVRSFTFGLKLDI